jgi:hypothetical protein
LSETSARIQDKVKDVLAKVKALNHSLPNDAIATVFFDMMSDRIKSRRRLFDDLKAKVDYHAKIEQQIAERLAEVEPSVIGDEALRSLESVL